MTEAGSHGARWERIPQFDVTGTVLMGLIMAPEAERRRRPDHLAQIEVEIHGDSPLRRVDSALAASAALLQSIDDLRSSAEQLAPEEWRKQYRDRAECGVLFLQGFEFHSSGAIRVLFDFGDLDLLVLDLHTDGRRSAVLEQ